MFDRFTDRAKKVMFLARKAALELNHDCIGPEHILLGLVDEGTSVAANVLKRRTVDLEQIRREVRDIVKTGRRKVKIDTLPFTPLAKKVLELSMEEAAQLSHNYIGTEHLLLGLIRETQSIAAQVLRKLGVELDAVREVVLEVQPRSSSSPPHRRTATGAGTLSDRFTDRAKKVMSFAHQEAMRFNHEDIGTEHILLGLVQEGSGVAAYVLKNMNIHLEKIRHEVENVVKPGPSMVTMSQLPLPFTPRVKKVLELAIEEVSQLSHNYIGTEHLLLGLIRENEGIAAQVMMNLGVKLEEVREELIEFIDIPREDRPG